MIITSGITEISQQSNGKNYIEELHIDDKGKKYKFIYLAEKDTDINSNLLNRAMVLSNQVLTKRDRS